jgi:DNA-binding IclR family transcriptional regulator
VLINVDLRDRAAPLLRELADALNESVLLAVKDGYYSLYIYAIESPSRLLARTAVGDRVPMHCTAIGKAILSYLPQTEVEEIVNHVGMQPSTDATITELPDLMQETERIRQRGYSIDQQEHEKNIFCIGAPIFNAAGRVIGACSVSGPDPEIIGSKQEQVSQRVLHTAQEISRLMGYMPLRNGLVVTRSTVELRNR